MSNLLNNPGFEQDLLFWTPFGDVSITNEAFTGTKAALFQKVSSLAQTVSVIGLSNQALLLGLTAYQPSTSQITVMLAITIEWFDSNSVSLGLGLEFNSRKFTNSQRTTILSITAKIPSTAATARVTLHRLWDGDLVIDQVFLTPFPSTNLIRNPSFELADDSWIWGHNMWPTGVYGAFEGSTAALFRVNGGPDQTIKQSVESPDLAEGYFLFSFALEYQQDISTYPITASVTWLDENDQAIKSGLSLPFGCRLLDNTLTCLCVTNQAPKNTSKATIQFLNDGTLNGIDLILDYVLLCRVKSANLLANNSFENGVTGWNIANAAIVTTSAYNSILLQGLSALALESIAGASSFYQDVGLSGAPGDTYLLSFAALPQANPNVLTTKVYWLDSADIVLGTALTILASSNAPLNKWSIFNGITDAAPLDAVRARIQFTKEASTNTNSLLIDNVIFTNLGNEKASPASIRGIWLK